MAHLQFSFLQSLLLCKNARLSSHEVFRRSKKKKKGVSLFLVIYKTRTSGFREETNLMEARNIVTVWRQVI